MIIRVGRVVGRVGLLVACVVVAQAQAGARLRLLGVTPSGTGVPPAQEIVFQFDHAMVPLGRMGRASASVPIVITPVLKCQWRWLDEERLACRLPGTEHFRPATRYTLRVGAGFAALDGARLARAVTATFTTQRPKVRWAYFQGWRSPVTPTYQVRFTLPVAASTIARAMSFVPVAGGRAVPARAEPFKQARHGPLLLPVPGVPGAVVWIENPRPAKPAHATQPTAVPREVWLLTPARPLAAHTRYRLKIGPGLVTPFGRLPGPTGPVWHTLFTTFGPFRFLGIGCGSGSGSWTMAKPVSPARSSGGCDPDQVWLVFNAPVPLSTLSAARWTPSPASRAKLRTLWEGYPSWMLRSAGAKGGAAKYYFKLPFDFKGVTRYRVEVPEGVTDRFGRKLPSAVARSFATGHLPPALALGAPNGGVLEAGQDTVLPVYFANLDRLNFTYRAVTAATLEGASTDANAPSVMTSLLAPFTGKPPRDRKLTVVLGVRPDLAGHSGALMGKLDWGSSLGRVYTDWYLNNNPLFAEVTPWEVLAKVGHFDTLVWVTSLSTGKPVAGVTVRFGTAPKHSLAGIGTLSASAVTGASGLAVLPGAVALGGGWTKRSAVGQPQWYMTATKGPDMALLPLSWSYLRWIGSASGGAFYGSQQPQYGHLRAWGLTAQGVYRPGATVRYAMFARGMAPDTLVPAPHLSYTFAIQDSTGKSVLTRKDVRLSAFGGLHGDLRVPKTAVTGWYDMTLSWRGGGTTQTRQVGRFLVAQFVPAAFKVRTLLEGKLFGPGVFYRAQVLARLHSGGPYTLAPVHSTVLIESEPFAPDTPLAAGFSFDANPPNTPASVTVSQDRGQLSDHGGIRVSGRLPQRSPIVYGRLVVQAAVKSARGKWVADRARGIWAARDRFVGLRLAGWLLHAGRPSTVHYLVVDAAGRPAAGASVRIALRRQKLNVVTTANGTGGFTPHQSTTWVEEDHCEAISTLAPGNCHLTPARAGVYRIVATVTDTRGRKETTTLDEWSVGPGEVLWKTGTHVQLVPDKTAYHVGDTAHILVQNPYPGAKALVTVERYGVLWKKTVTLAGSTPVLTIPIERAFFPGAYMSVAIFSGRVARPDSADLGRPTLALGYVALPVVGKGSSLSVTVTPARTDYKPRQLVTARVDVKNAQGKPAAHTRLVVAVVDEAVLDLLKGRSRYYDPRRSFYAPPQGPDMLDYSLVSQLITTVRTPSLGKGVTPGGGGGGGLPIRSVFKYTAYWNPGLQTDGTGEAAFSFKLPDNLTGWRLVVMALSPGAAMGLGQATVRVNLPIELEPALPNVVRAGDRFGAAFSVTDRTQQPRRVRVDIAARGAAQGAAARTLSLSPYGHGLAWLDLTAPAPGVIHLLATARSGKLGDALRKTIPVEAAGTPETAASYGSLTRSSASLAVKVPKEAIPGSASLVVDLAPTALAHLAAAFDSMREDPLDTWEVHLSRAVMAADYLGLKAALPPSVGWSGAAAEIRETLGHAGDFQAPNGGMAFLIPRNEFVSAYLSAYTALAFDWLDSAGHPPPESVRAALDRYLRHDILRRPAQDAMPGWLDLKVVALDALAGEGKLPSGEVAGLVPELAHLSLFGKALLLQMAVTGHDADSAGRILTDILARSEQTSGSLSFQETESDAYSSMLASPLRANCAVLDALVSVVEAGGPAARRVAPMTGRLVRWIDERRNAAGAWPNSQENVFCTTAEAHYARVFEGPVRDLGGRVIAASRTIGEARFATRRSPPHTVTAPAPAGATSVVVEHHGQGRLYYNVRLAYTVPVTMAGAVDAGISVQREYQVERGKDWVRIGPRTVLRRGDVVRVDLTVDVPAERHYVVLTDPLPGAFEAVNHQLATADVTAPHKMPGGTTLWFDYGAWPNYSVTTSGFYHRDIARDAVRFYAHILPAGHYQLIYAAQVISPGRFIAPPPQAHEIYQPEVFGRGQADTVEVAAPAQPRTAAQSGR